MKSKYAEEPEEANGSFVILSAAEWSDFLARDSVPIPDRHKTHFGKVLRRVGKYGVSLCDGNGTTCQALAEAGHYRKTSETAQHPRPVRNVTLVQAELKNKGMSLMLQKTTELGVAQVIIVHADHSQTRTKEVSRFMTILENACMQSQNPYLPQIDIFCGKVSEIDIAGLGQAWWGDVTGQPPLTRLSGTQPRSFFNGPEGGWSEPEKKWLKNNFPCVSLSENVLRAETAAICAAFWLKQA